MASWKAAKEKRPRKPRLDGSLRTNSTAARAAAIRGCEAGTNLEPEAMAPHPSERYPGVTGCG
jgi:hypothetical protein